MRFRAAAPISMLGFASLLVLATAIAAKAPPRVIIVALGDDYGFNNVGYPHRPLDKGNPEMRTPNLDELAMAGIRLERHYVYKVCSPTRSSLLSGRLAVHVNQNNANNDARAASGIDLRMTTLPQKLKALGNWRTAMVGKWHCGARSLANLPINRGFDFHFGFLKGGEDHFQQNHCAGGPDGDTVDLWLNHGPAFGHNGTYSAFIYTDMVLEVLRNFTRDHRKDPDLRLFIYLPWHNTHDPLEAPDNYLYPAYFNNSFSTRMMYNAMARALDDGMGNITAELRQADLFNETVMLFSADNGGWLLPDGRAGANNYPLRGGKATDFEGGVRAVSFLSGGYLPADARGKRHHGFISIADWYASFIALAGGDPSDDAPGVPKIDSVDVWSSLLSETNSTPRSWLPLSFDAKSGNRALIVDGMKIICGEQGGDGFWQGPVFPNSSGTFMDPGCPDCCLFDIVRDELETHDLRLEKPDLFQSMKKQLEDMGSKVYQTDYPEPNTSSCLSDHQAKGYYQGFIGPVCFTESPVPPSPPPRHFALVRDDGKICLRPGNGSTVVAAACVGSSDDASWVEEKEETDGWLAWAGTSLRYIKVDEHNATKRSDFCTRGRLYLNPDAGSGKNEQGFKIDNATGTLGSTLCVGTSFHCLVAPEDGTGAHTGRCDGPTARGWERVYATELQRFRSEPVFTV